MEKFRWTTDLIVILALAISGLVMFSFVKINYTPAYAVVVALIVGFAAAISIARNTLIPFIKALAYTLLVVFIFRSYYNFLNLSEMINSSNPADKVTVITILSIPLVFAAALNSKEHKFRQNLMLSSAALLIVGYFLAQTREPLFAIVSVVLLPLGFTALGMGLANLIVWSLSMFNPYLKNWISK
jgi:hypothetical protein